MKKIYNLLCCVLLTVMLCVGIFSVFDVDATFSEAENRKLKTAPGLTFSSLLDGSYHTAFREYYADTFPGREDLMETNKTLNGFYYFSGLSGEGGTQLVVDFNSGAAQHGESLKETQGTEDPASTDSSDATGTSTEEPTTLPVQTEPAAKGEQLGSVLLVGDRAIDVPYANHDNIVSYAQSVNAIAQTLGPDVKTYVMPIPNSAEFYTSKEYHSGSCSQIAMFDLCKENLDSSITYVNAYAALAQHTNEYIYFRTDHHWTHLGAYYAYGALCDAVGFTPEPQSKFATGQWENFVGSLYTYISNYPQSAVLKDNPDTVYYWKPYVDVKTSCYNGTDLVNPYIMGTICKVPETEDNKYLTFMGGDHPITVVETDVEGPTILVIKESYGNALISWLTSHYSKIVLIDPREYFSRHDDLDLKTFAESQGIDQCLVINYPMMLNSGDYISWLKKMVQ